jgi:pimeloyl-ACP methyl ester carboxylesterase
MSAVPQFPMRTPILRWLLALLAVSLPSALAAVPLHLSSPPFSLDGTAALFVRDVVYGPHARNTLDIFLPANAYAAKRPTPLVVFIHGGGFSSGSKKQAYTRGNRQELALLLQHGIAYASINYPLLERHERQGLIKSLHGARRALQFLRLNRETYNIDPERIVLLGSSAGGSTALWLALHDDMADPHSQDPLERQSTRVRGAVATEVQATLDIVRWEEVFEEYRFTVSTLEKAKVLYGIETLQQLHDPRIVQYRQEVDLLRLMDSADPEIWVANRKIMVTAPNTASILFHHPYHARALQAQAMRVGLKGQFHIPQMNIMPTEQESAFDFILRKVR